MPQTPIEADLLRTILRRFAAGVTVITSVTDEGKPAGMTATAFSSVSLNPPMVLVCVDANARTRRAIEGHTAFAVNLLDAEQGEVAKRFASSLVDKFEGIAWRPGATGVPVLDDSLARIECRVQKAVEAGTHVIYIGEVLAGGVKPGAHEPLLYYEGIYRLLGAEP